MEVAACLSEGGVNFLRILKTSKFSLVAVKTKERCRGWREVRRRRWELRREGGR
jgi:hypothetical protein